MKTILASGAISLIVTLFGTRFAIALLVKQGYGQFIRDDGPTSHHTKRGTPTMGGAVILAAIALGYFGAHLVVWTVPSVSGMLAVGLTVSLGLVGFADDWIKVSKHRSLGLTSRVKLAAQGAVALAFGILCFQFPDARGMTPGSQAISFLRDLPWLTMPIWLAVLWIIFLISAWSNAVNLTDGLDGLATGACAMVFVAYALVNIWQNNQNCAVASTASVQCYEVRSPLDMAVFCVAVAAGCFGFLWWNASPAKIFMGDTGSLALGGAIAAVSILTRTEIMAGIMGGLFVIITCSVLLQVGYFKLTKGKRLFKMAPLQHHFELKGWAEITIVIRFWLVCGICVATAVGLFYGEWVIGQ
ncbi:MAG: phospho-N-acetylmuramoyl-pentapeptide-transferase [Propionibacteriaceae bacterium]|nr:phospho-N-acetylmuramoyl-pentapeptide-transferase [Micropruina sp.]HBX80516.1 phospho-N-acetylmuramoyl-pentapeptide-transferase [Propionibacteriaceae bacterium]HBY23064.1 phospho-N-acetylmuramoyl-pentapeptide-transferase [Propionibacteriaceae bacterium]